jgi:ATP-dependent DNA ligase
MIRSAPDWCFSRYAKRGGIWETIQPRKKRMGNESASSRTKSLIKSARQPVKQLPKRKSNPARGAARYIQPMLIQLVHKLPEGEHWQYEVKWDGYRGLAVIQNPRLWSRNECDLGKRFPPIAEALRHFPGKSAVLDGELVVLEMTENPPSRRYNISIHRTPSIVLLCVRSPPLKRGGFSVAAAC